MSSENNNKGGGGGLAGSLGVLFLVFAYNTLTDFDKYDSTTQGFIITRDLSTLVLGGVILWVTFEQEANTAFLNFIALVLGVFIYFIARAYGITIYEFFDKTGFISSVGRFLSNIMLPSLVGFGVTRLSAKIYSQKSKIRMGVLLFTMLTLVIRELFDGRIHAEFSHALERAKPNIFFLAGTLLSIIFHPVADD